MDAASLQPAETQPTSGGAAPASAAPAPPTAPPLRSRWSRWRRSAVAGGFVAVIVFAAGALIALALTQEKPGWWQAVDPADPATIATAERVENHAATLFSRARPPNAEGDPDKPWTVGIKSAEANAWLNARLRVWLESQESGRGDGTRFRWPDELGQIQVEFDDGRIYLGATLRQGRTEQVLTAVLEPEFREDGSLWLPATRVDVGRLPIPAGWVLGTPDPSSVEAVPDDLARLPQTREALLALAGQGPMMRTPTVRLGDGRRVRLLALEAEDGRLLVTCRTEQAGKSGGDGRQRSGR